MKRYLNNEDKLNYRNIKIRDILVDEDKLYIVTNGRQKIDPNLKPGDKHDKNYYGSTNILVGKLNLDEPTIQLESFFSSGEEKYIINDEYLVLVIRNNLITNLILIKVNI